MRTTLITLFIMAYIATSAQTSSESNRLTQKIGYADWNYIFSQMPEFKQIDSELKTHGEQLQSQLQAKYKEYEAKLKAYQTGAATMIDAVRADKETELSQLQENIQKFEQDAQSSLQTKQNDLMTPVYSKVGKAIEQVAKENQYSFIINPQLVGGGDILLYNDKKYNISSLVLKNMGITPKESSTSKP